MPTWTCPHCRTPHVYNHADEGREGMCSKCSKLGTLSEIAVSASAGASNPAIVKGSELIEILQMFCVFGALLGAMLLVAAFVFSNSNPYTSATALAGASMLVAAGAFALQLEMLNDICKSRKLLERISEQLQARK